MTPAAPRPTPLLPPITRRGLTRIALGVCWLSLTALFGLHRLPLNLHAAETPPPPPQPWTVGTPIVTYWAGPPLTDATAQQMAEGGWNVVWCGEAELDVAHRHGLRAQLQHGLLTPATLENPAQRAQLDALIDRVRLHPALYAYFITDEPGATQFPALGKLVGYLRQRDPAHLAYINLFPTYANNEQLGTPGDKLTAYREHLRLYLDQVKPALVSYDHYQFAVAGDNPDYFLNLALIRQAAQDRNVPFLNIVQACTWTPSMRVPRPDEMRYLVYTTLAYGALGISYYVYSWPGHTGMIVSSNGVPTELYHALKTLNREFTAIATQTQPLRSLGVYHAGMLPPGTEPLPATSPFQIDPPLPLRDFTPPKPAQGVLLGLFGPTPARLPREATYALVVNVDYLTETTLNLTAPAPLQVFNPTTRHWSPPGPSPARITLSRGAGQLLRLSP